MARDLDPGRLEPLVGRRDLVERRLAVARQLGLPPVEEDPVRLSDLRLGKCLRGRHAGKPNDYDRQAHGTPPRLARALLRKGAKPAQAGGKLLISPCCRKRARTAAMAERASASITPPPAGSATAASRSPTTWLPPIETLAARTFPFSHVPPEKVANCPDALPRTVRPSNGAMKRPPPLVWPASASACPAQ